MLGVEFFKKQLLQCILYIKLKCIYLKAYDKIDMHVLATPLRKKNLLPCRFRSVRLHALLQRRFGPCRLHYPSFLPSALGQREAQQETGRQERGRSSSSGWLFSRALRPVWFSLGPGNTTFCFFFFFWLRNDSRSLLLLIPGLPHSLLFGFSVLPSPMLVFSD